MGLFSRDAVCDRCAAPRPRDQLSLFDETFRGARKGLKQRLCRECLKLRMHEAFAMFPARAAVVRPSTAYSGYQFYALSEMPKFRFDEAQIEEVRRRLAPEGSVCKRCGQQARFSWTSDLILTDDERPPHVTPADNEASGETLCGRCIGEEFSRALDDLAISFYEIQPPVDEDGLLTPFEA